MSELKFPAVPLLPTITNAYGPVERYLEYVAALPGPAAAPAVALRPVDAVLIQLLAACQPGRTRVVDLASAATGGASTVLARTLPEVRVVYAPPGSEEGHSFVLARYFKDLEQPLAECAVLDGPDGLRAAVHPHTPVLVLTSPGARADTSLAMEIRRWLGADRAACAVVVGVGPTGACPALRDLATFGEGPYQVTLLRELAPALANSTLAVVGPRGQDSLAEALFRIGRLYNDHFGYLDLVRQACHSALRQALTEDTTARAGALTDQSFSRYALQQALDERTRELHALRNTLAVRLDGKFRRLVRFLVPPGGRVRRTLRFLAPEGSPQRWVARKVRGLIGSR